MSTSTQKAVISNEALVSDLESKLNLVTPEAKIIIADTINRINNIGKYISEFLKRGTSLTIGPAPELVINEANIRQSLERVIQREKTQGNKKDVWIDNDIWGCDALKGRIMTAIEKQFSVTIYRFTQQVTYAKVGEETDKLLVKKDWNIAEAWNIIIAGILAGEVDVNGTGIFAYFTVKKQGEDVLYRFDAYRNDDGQLDVYGVKVYQSLEWHAGYGVVLGN